MTDPRSQISSLADDPRVQLIGVRHHSPVLAAAVPALLDAFDPATVLVELPAEMQPWLGGLADPGLSAPVALAAADPDGAVAFYPFADFSPELAALRWAHRRGVPAICCDLPLVDRAWRARAGSAPAASEPGHAGQASSGTAASGADRESGAGSVAGSSWAEAVQATLTGRADDDLWDRWVEAGAPGSPPESVRRAALAAGWALRQDASRSGFDAIDLAREAWMRGHLSRTRGRVSVVVGAFHAPALLDGPVPDEFPLVSAAELPRSEAEPVISLVPYTFDLLDARSGYPAGIRDPRWQQAVHECAADPEGIRRAADRFAVEVTRELRAHGQPAGPGEAAEVARLAADLASLRSLPAPGRGELVEALQTVLAQGAPAGVGRGVARAMDTVLIGQRRGRLPKGTPVTGLRPAVEADLVRLKLPGPGEKWKQVRLDPMRSPTDRERDLMIRRLNAFGALYGSAGTSGPVPGGETLTTTWRVEWTPSADAALAVAALHGVTTAQAAEGVLASRRRREQQAGGPTAEQALAGLEEAAACGLPSLTRARLSDVRGMVGGLEQIVAGLRLLGRLERGHLGEPLVDVSDARDTLQAAAVAAVAGLTGSQRLEDARALLDLVQSADESGRRLRLGHAIKTLARDGSPLMRGAAAAVGVLLGHEEPQAFGVRLGSWADLPGAEATDRLRGALSVAGALLQSPGEALTPLLTVIETMPDDTFVRRLPALRGGFDALSPADRDRLLETVTDRHGDFSAALPTDAITLAAWMAADRAGAAAIRFVGLSVDAVAPSGASGAKPSASGAMSAGPSGVGAIERSPFGAMSAGPSGSASGATFVGAGPLDVVPPGPPAAEPSGTGAVSGGAGPSGVSATERSGSGATFAGAGPVDVVSSGAPATEPSLSSVTFAGVGAVGDSSPGASVLGRSLGADAAGERAVEIAAVERWRLLLGRESDQLAPGRRRLATALDELYGGGRGEGAYTVGGGGGQETAYPEARDWLKDVEALFGADVRDEVLARAAEKGRLDALLVADPDRVRASVDLLHAVLSLAGGLPEARLAKLRPLVARLTDELTARLARRIRPALTGIGTPRPTLRPSGRLDLAATLRRNLHTARTDGDGRVRIVPERPVFRSRGRRSVDWQVILLVDVSGSMEESTIWAALTASVLAGVPALRTHFVTFSTEVIDLTDRVTDPLSLLLGIRVGGGTHIAAALRYARQMSVVPARTMVITISDFEEGFPLGDLLGATRALVDDGVTLLGCASLDDQGRPRYSTGVAGQLVAAGMPVAALSPLELAGWIGDRVR
ncbi:DUF5682 family protein [Paractinoplanes brasiliensis]|uniref:VWA domain containing CoxE-like protein n=1 Tax=Paractinoplanes brasiliensis TaxID=52695 RepID=A0A4R6JZT7_9ACTN|nr:DUF5682 family protein [Actinoplanes brasiliensis]TDO41301.1 VWA domain containing CoxE-like protein [Actinoplanes brasiliensis]GID27416.1 hypothetical protein Abr02nite_23990 [Actinoplanes brasiliensis]